MFCFNKGFLLRNERFAESVEIFQLRNPFRIRSVEIPYLRFFFSLSDKTVLSRDVAPVGEDRSEERRTREREHRPATANKVRSGKASDRHGALAAFNTPLDFGAVLPRLGDPRDLLAFPGEGGGGVGGG